MTTLTTRAAAGPALDPGKARSLQRVTSEDGFFLICALDHLSDFQQLLAPDPATVDYAKTVAAKLELIRALAPEVSAFLLDARFGLAQAIFARALPGQVGLMASIEDEDYRHAPGARRTRLRESWGTKQIKLLGADVCKLLWFYRPDAPTAEHQRQVVVQLADECRELSLPLVVEPIWYPLVGEDTTSSAWRRRRVDGIIESAHTAAQLGIDMLKVEFPGDVGSEEARESAAEACARLDAGVEVPWVILSAGVGYDDFKRQVEIASAAGGSGFLAGRSIWRDAVSIHEPERRRVAARQAAGRLAELAAITRARGRPFRPALEGEDLIGAVAEDWYAGWHAQAQTDQLTKMAAPR
jgi:tagatose 1,6-diphosphate aldolase